MRLFTLSLCRAMQPPVAQQQFVGCAIVYAYARRSLCARSGISSGTSSGSMLLRSFSSPSCFTQRRYVNVIESKSSAASPLRRKESREGRRLYPQPQRQGRTQQVARPTKKVGYHPTVARAADTASSSKMIAVGSPMRSRFGRIAAERGYAFALYYYTVGEGLTIAVTVLLHTDYFGIGEVGSWLHSITGMNTDRYLEIGPVFLGVRWSPRLLLNYVAVNACFTFPLRGAELAFCVATMPLLRAVGSPFKAMMARLMPGKSRPHIPKAPSAAPTKS